MRVSVDSPSSLQSTLALPSWRAILAVLLGSAEKARHYFASIGSRTTLIRDPFSAEQSRD